MAYIELVDSPKELGKRIEKRERLYPSIEEIREKAPTMEIYDKPVLHVSENKRTAFLGGIGTLLTRMREIPLPTVNDVMAKLVKLPDLNPEFSNLPGPGQPGEKEAFEKIAKAQAESKRYAKEVAERHKSEKRSERARLRATTGHTRKIKQAAAAAKAKKAAKEATGKTQPEAKEGTDKTSKPKPSENSNVKA